MGDAGKKTQQLTKAFATTPLHSMKPCLTTQTLIPESTASIFAQIRPIGETLKTLGAASYDFQTKAHPFFTAVQPLQTAMQRYESSLGIGRIHKAMEEWRKSLRPLITIAEQAQALYPPLLQAQQPMKVAGIASLAKLPDSITRIQSAMQGMGIGATCQMAQLTQVKVFATVLETSTIAALAAEMLSPAVADYLEARPFTEADWEEASRTLDFEEDEGGSEGEGDMDKVKFHSVTGK